MRFERPSRNNRYGGVGGGVDVGDPVSVLAEAVVRENWIDGAGAGKRREEYEPGGKLRYDLQYVKSQSFTLDVKIVVRQVWKVVVDTVRE